MKGIMKLEKEKIIDMLIYLDLSLNAAHDRGNTNIYAALFQLEEKYKGISNSTKRHKMICEIIKELEK